MTFPLSYHHSTRLRIPNGLPCWLTGYIPLPEMSFEPCDPEREPANAGKWRARIMVGGSWAYAYGLPAEALGPLLLRWEADPEGTCREIFGRDPPIKGSPNDSRMAGLHRSARGQVANASPDDLGL